jgi:acyl-CoA thioesterase-2
VTDLWNDLLSCLNLTLIEDDERAANRDITAFEGGNQKLEYHRIFGGQILSQFIRAASLTCPDKTVKSLHTVFAREGHAEAPLRYEVTLQHVGRSFASLTITARQDPKVVATASICMHAPEGGPDRQTVAEIPALLGAENRTSLDLIPWETRSADDLDTTAAGPPRFELWMRTPSVDPDLAQALTAYATDLTLIGTALRPLEGFSQKGNGTAFTSAVTSHTLWFHRPFRTDQWLLLRQRSPLMAHGRSFGVGDVLTEDGSLVASYAQEALLRLPH